MGRGAFAGIIQLLGCPGEMWVTLRAFSSSKKEPVALTKAVPSKPSVSSETLKACALIGVHLLAAGDGAGSSGCQSPDFRDMWRDGCPKSPDWDSDGETWSESEGFSSSDSREHIVESLALSQQGKPLSQRGRAEVVKARDVVREIEVTS